MHIEHSALKRPDNASKGIRKQNIPNAAAPSEEQTGVERMPLASKEPTAPRKHNSQGRSSGAATQIMHPRGCLVPARQGRRSQSTSSGTATQRRASTNRKPVSRTHMHNREITSTAGCPHQKGSKRQQQWKANSKSRAKAEAGKCPKVENSGPHPPETTLLLHAWCHHPRPSALILNAAREQDRRILPLLRLFLLVRLGGLYVWQTWWSELWSRCAFL